MRCASARMCPQAAPSEFSPDECSDFTTPPIACLRRAAAPSIIFQAAVPECSPPHLTPVRLRWTPVLMRLRLPFAVPAARHALDFSVASFMLCRFCRARFSAVHETFRRRAAFPCFAQEVSCALRRKKASNKRCLIAFVFPVERVFTLAISPLAASSFRMPFFACLA